MKRSISGLLAGVILITLALSAYSQKTENKTTSVENTLIIKTSEGKDTINRNLYGHFAEHLGSCIYSGIWVGENSSIPNTRGIRNDVVEALKGS